MNFNLNNRKLNSPNNIELSFPRNIKKMIITWNRVFNPDINNNDILNPIISVNYNVYRSTSINGLYIKINKVLIDSNRYEDTSIGINPNTLYWYKVSTVATFFDGTTSESKLSEPVTYKVRNDNKWFNKMNERNMWILKNDSVLMDLYIRKTEGERCPKCWDDIRGQSANPNCDICFGTTFIGGYEPVFQIYVRQKPASQQLDLSSQGYIVNSNPGAWTISSIQLRNRDILINPEGRMFSIITSQINHAAGYMFHQELQMKEIDPTDVRYNICRTSLYPEF